MQTVEKLKTRSKTGVVLIIVGLITMFAGIYVYCRTNKNEDLKLQENNIIENQNADRQDKLNELDELDELNNLEETLDKDNNIDNIDNTATNTNTQQNIIQTGDMKTIYKETFKNSIFIGDSITEGLSSYQLINEENVIASKGLTALKAQKEVDKGINSNTNNVFILLGINDLLNGISSEQYASQYRQLIQNIKNKIPKSEIYIQTTFPVTTKIEKEKPGLINIRIDEFNNAIKEMAEEENIKFLYVTSLFKDEQGKMREECVSDGIHLKYKTYGLWLDYLKDYIK